MDWAGEGGANACVPGSSFTSCRDVCSADGPGCSWFGTGFLSPRSTYSPTRTFSTRGGWAALEFCRSLRSAHARSRVGTRGSSWRRSGAMPTAAQATHHHNFGANPSASATFIGSPLSVPDMLTGHEPGGRASVGASREDRLRAAVLERLAPTLAPPKAGFTEGRRPPPPPAPRHPDPAGATAPRRAHNGTARPSLDPPATLRESRARVRRGGQARNPFDP